MRFTHQALHGLGDAQQNFEQLESIVGFTISGPYTVASGTLAVQNSQSTVTLSNLPMTTTAYLLAGGMVDGSGTFSHTIGWRHGGYNPATRSDTFVFYSLSANPNVSGTLTVFYLTAV